MHEDILDLFALPYGGLFHQYIALPLVCGRPVLAFNKLLRSFVQNIREKFGFPVLLKIDDFIAAQSPLGRLSTARDCEKAEEKLSL